MTGIPNGPHSGREIELMLAGTKPVALFTIPDHGTSRQRLAALDEAAQQGRLLRGAFESRVFYCQPSKLADMKELMALYQRLDANAQAHHSSFKPTETDHIRIGQLLGYSAEDIDAFIRQQRWLDARGFNRPHP